MLLRLGGNDRISALSGNDIVCGGAGDDVVDGGSGPDRLFGDESNGQSATGTGRVDGSMAMTISMEEQEMTGLMARLAMMKSMAQAATMGPWLNWC